MTPRSRFAIALACASVACGAAAAQDRADIDRSQIVGNRELPKVLYIVPWKKPLPGELSGRPVNSVLDEALAVDRPRRVPSAAALRPAVAAASGLAAQVKRRVPHSHPCH